MHIEPVNLLYYGGIGDLFLSVIVTLILFPMYVRFIRQESVPHNGRLVKSGISLLVPVLCVIVALMIRPFTYNHQFFLLLYQLLLLIFEAFMIINAIILFNIFRCVVTKKSSVVAILYGLLTIMGTLLGMALVGITWYLVLI